MLMVMSFYWQNNLSFKDQHSTRIRDRHILKDPSSEQPSPCSDSGDSHSLFLTPMFFIVALLSVIGEILLPWRSITVERSVRIHLVKSSRPLDLDLCFCLFQWSLFLWYYLSLEPGAEIHNKGYLFSAMQRVHCSAKHLLFVSFCVLFLVCVCVGGVKP